MVCYDTGAMQLFGYRAAWMFQAMGHNNVSVLDGGLPKWNAEGRPVDSFLPNFGGAKNGNFDYKLNEDKIKLLQEMKAFAKNEVDRTYHLLDVRIPEQFNAGHIEGAQNFPMSLVLNVDKSLKPVDVRKAAFESAGVDLSKNITLSCNTGVQASAVWCALRDLATGSVSVYDGSWSEYSKN